MRIILAFLLFAVVAGLALFMTFTSSWGALWAPQVDAESTAVVEEVPPTPTPDWTGKIVLDITQPVVLRAAPAPSAETVDVLSRGDRIALAGCDAEVLWCQTEDGAWMFAYMEEIPDEAPILGSPGLTVAEARVMPTPTEEAPPTPTPDPTPSVSLTQLLPTPTATPALADTLVAEPANLRTGPGTEFDRAGTLNAGDAVQLAGKTADGAWYQLADGNWIAAFLVEPPTAELPIIDTGATQ